MLDPSNNKKLLKEEYYQLILSICKDKNMALLNIHHDDETIRRIAKEALRNVN
jgi:ABC-type thiamine transport system ATPase subunit